MQKCDKEHITNCKIGYFLQSIGSLNCTVPLVELAKTQDGFDEIKKTSQEFIVNIDFGKDSDLCDYLPTFLKKEYFKDFAGINSGILLYGNKGGKSVALGYACNYAFKNNWVVMKVTNTHDMTTKIPMEVFRHEESRLYLHFKEAQQILRDFVASNKDLLTSIPVNLDIYGKYDVAGQHQDEPRSVRNTFDKWRQFHFFDTDSFEKQELIENLIQEQRYMRETVGQRLKSPKNLLELASYGLEHATWSINTLAEVLEQLYSLDSHNVMIAVDNYNEMFRRSPIRDYRYFGNKNLRGYVPPYHFALVRLFMRFDGHKIKNGIKLFASSHKHLYKHVFTPEKINFPGKGFSHEMKSLDLALVRSAIQNYINTGMIPAEINSEENVQLTYLETQGDFKQVGLFGFNCYNRVFINKDHRNR